MYCRLSILSGIAIAAVVLNHAGGWGLTAWISWAHRYQPGASTPNTGQIWPRCKTALSVNARASLSAGAGEFRANPELPNTAANRQQRAARFIGL